MVEEKGQSYIKPLSPASKTALIEKSIEEFSRFRNYCGIAEKLDKLDEDTGELLRNLMGKKTRVFLAADWKDFSAKCSEGLKELGEILREEYGKRISDTRAALQRALTLDIPMKEVEIPLGLAERELDKGHLEKCYYFLEHAIDVNDNIVKPYIEYASELQKARGDLEKIAGKGANTSQLEQLIELSEETAERGDFLGALEVARNCREHIKRLGLSHMARDAIRNMRLRLLDLKDIRPSDLPEKDVFPELDRCLSRAKYEYNKENYGEAMEIIASAMDELVEKDRLIRKEYCKRLIGKYRRTMKDLRKNDLISQQNTIMIRSVLDEAAELYEKERFSEASLKGEQAQERLDRILEEKGKKFCEEHEDRIKGSVAGLKERELANEEIRNAYDQYIQNRAKGNYLRCRELIKELDKVVHSTYQDHINEELWQVKNRIEMTDGIGGEIDDITSGLIIVQENFDNRNYDTALDILDKVTEKVDEKEGEERELLEELGERTESVRDILVLMDGKGEDVGELFDNIDTVSDLLENGELLEGRKVLDRTEGSIYGIIDNFFLNLDVLKGEIEDMGIRTLGIFDRSKEGRIALDRNQFGRAFNIVNEIRLGVAELKRRLIEQVEGKGEKEVLESDTGEEISSEELLERIVPMEEALVPTGRRKEEGALKMTEELLDISKETQKTRDLDKVDFDEMNIVDLATKTSEMLDLLAKRGAELGTLEREMDLAMEWMEEEDWGMAHKYLHRCINKAWNLVRKTGEDVGIDELINRIKEVYAEVDEQTARGIELGKVKENLDECLSLAQRGNMKRSVSLLNEATGMMEERLALYDRLIDGISDIQERLSRLKRENYDTSSAETLFEQIKELARRGKYSDALESCDVCGEKLEEIEDRPEEDASAGGDKCFILCPNCGSSVRKPEDSFFIMVQCPECSTELDL